MSASKGFTLVEMLIVITLIAILISAATLSFQSWIVARNIEKQTREVQADLLEQRLAAIQQKQTREIVFAPNQITFNRYSSEETTATLLQTKRNRYAMTRISSAETRPLITIRCNSRGQIVTGSSEPYRQIIAVLPPNSVKPDFKAGDNCIIVSDTLTKIGTMANASSCTAR